METEKKAEDNARGVSQETAEETALKDEAPKDEPTPPAQEGKNVDDGEDWKANSRKWEDRAKANRQRVADLETELSEANSRIAQLETQISERESTLLRTEVAAAKGVPAHRITGTTREELEADADKFLTEVGSHKRYGYVPSAGTGREMDGTSVSAGRERARAFLGHKD